MNPVLDEMEDKRDQTSQGTPRKRNIFESFPPVREACANLSDGYELAANMHMPNQFGKLGHPVVFPLKRRISE